MPATQTVVKSWSARLAKSCSLAVGGCLLFASAFPLLFWNEDNGVRTAQALREAQENCVPLTDVSAVNPEAEGKIVYLTGKAVGGAVPEDKPFALSAAGIRLTRHVEFYQWVEDKQEATEKQVGGSTKTTYVYSYRTKWVAAPVGSDNFYERGHENLRAWEGIDDEPFYTDTVHVGAYHLRPDQVERIGGKPWNMDFIDPNLLAQFRVISDFFSRAQAPRVCHDKAFSLHGYQLPEELRSHCELRGDEVYIHVFSGSLREDGRYEFPNDPQVGDMRVRWTLVPTDVPVTLIAQQHGDSFVPYISKGCRGTVNLIRDGEWAVDELFEDAATNNKLLTWGLRGLGFLMLFFGLMLLAKPLEILADVLPPIGNIVAFLTIPVCFVLALAIALGTIAVAWLAARPVLGYSLLALVALCVLYLVRRCGKSAAEEPQGPSADAL